MEPFVYRVKNDVPYYELNFVPGESNLVAGFSAKLSDSSYLDYSYISSSDKNRAINNRQRLLTTLDFDLPCDSWTSGQQIHSTNIKFVNTTDKGFFIPDTDGLITKCKDLVLAAYFADCVPLYFYAQDIETIGIAHAGWRGTVANMASKMLDKLKQHGADINSIYAAIGPSIGLCCYEVDENVWEKFKEACGVKIWRKIAKVNKAKNKVNLNLKLTNALFMQEAGLKTENISITKHCTSCQSDTFYSYRRDGAMTGRMAGWIGFSS